MRSTSPRRRVGRVERGIMLRNATPTIRVSLALLAAAALCMTVGQSIAADVDRTAPQEREPVISGISKKLPVLSVPSDRRCVSDLPDAEVRWYGVGFAFQVGPRLAGLLCNRHIDDDGDHEDGSDLFLFDTIAGIQATNAIALSRNESRLNPKTGQREVATKYPMTGGFVPLGARRADGSSHPHAGSGFGIVNMILHSGSKSVAHLQVHQFSFDGRKFHAFADTPAWDASRIKVAGAGWTIEINGLSMAIPDGDDLLYPAMARKGEVVGCGVSRWQRRDGSWQPVAFLPVIGSGSEPTLSRDVDGSLLFCVRGVPSSPKAIVSLRVWRSTDGGQTWELIVDKPDLVGGNPISVNRALDGTPYVVSNTVKEDRSYSREVLVLWPLNAQRSGLEPRLVVRDGPGEFGRPSTRAWKLDHPTSATLRLGDGRWRHFLIYRGKEDPTSRGPTPQAGCYVEEVSSTGLALPLWNLADDASP